MNTSRFYLNTRDKTSGTPNDATWIYPNIIDRFSQFQLELEQACIINAVYPTNSLNNTIVFAENSNDGSLATCIIPVGVYTGVAYSLALSTVMTSASLNGYVYTATYSSVSKKITLSADGAHVFRLTNASTALTQMGFTTLLVGHQNSETSQSPVSLAGSAYVDVIASFQTNALDSSGFSKNILTRLYLTSDFGSYIFYTTSNINTKISVSNVDLQRITLTLKDDQGNDFALPNAIQCSYVLALNPIG
jgi:hypothetical protein